AEHVLDGAVDVDGCEAVEVAVVGPGGRLSARLDVGDALAEWPLFELAVRISIGAPSALPLPGFVGGRLDAQDRSLLVVHLGRVAASGVANTDALGADLVVGDDFAAV